MCESHHLQSFMFLQVQQNLVVFTKKLEICNFIDIQCDQDDLMF